MAFMVIRTNSESAALRARNGNEQESTNGAIDSSSRTACRISNGTETIVLVFGDILTPIWIFVITDRFLSLYKKGTKEKLFPLALIMVMYMVFLLGYTYVFFSK